MHVHRGRRADTCDHGLPRRSLRVKTSYELNWKVKSDEHKYINSVSTVVVVNEKNVVWSTLYRAAHEYRRHIQDTVTPLELHPPFRGLNYLELGEDIFLPF